MSTPSAITAREYGGDRTLVSCVLAAALLLTLLVAALSPGLAFTVTFCLVVALFSFFRSEVFLLLVVFCLPLSPVIATGLPLHNMSTFTQVSMFIGFAAGRLRRQDGLRRWFFADRLNRLAILFVVATLACTFVFHSATVSSLRASSELVAGLCLFLTLTAWVETQEEVKRILYAVCVSGTLVSCFGFYQRVIDDYGDVYFWLYPRQAEVLEPWTGRITSVLNYSNSLAGYLNLVLPIALGLLLVPLGARLRTVALTALATGSAALVLTASRGGLASFLAVLLLAAAYVARQARSRKWLLIAGLATAALGLILFFGLLRTPWAEEDQSAAMRLLFWGVAATLFIGSPVVGVGYGNFRDLYDLPGIAPGVFDVHNLYLQLLCETGIVGFLAFAVLVVFVIRRCLRTLKRKERGLGTIVNFAALGAVVALLLHGFVDFLFIVSPQFTALFWTILALLVVADRWPRERGFSEAGA
jgi:putative inorganic carbon (HCO3(-)) transporter